MPRSLAALAALATLAAAPTVHASFPAGVWGLVDSVTFEPDPKNPTMVRIDGIFMVANLPPDFPQYPGYAEPKPGYMYYKCADKQLATCVMEWQELAKVAGTDNRCRGWGDSSLPANGTVRAGPQQPLNPDLYPIAMGILMGFTPCEALKDWEANNAGGTSTTGESTGEPDPGTSSGGQSSTSPGSTSAATTSAGETGGCGVMGARCGETEGPATTGGGETGGGPSTGAESGGNLSSDGVTEGVPGGSTGPAGSTSGGSGSSTGAPADSGAPAKDDAGCACDSAADPAPHALGALAVLAGLGLVRRRRRAA